MKVALGGLAALVLLGVSVAFAYGIAGRSFQPIERMVDQVEAISDGRSLHRRLNIGTAGQELARLAGTLNEMIGRLETSFGALRRFTADASHELKTPLAVIRADVERAMSPTTTETEQAIALEEALQQVTRMADLVDSLLTLARADEGRFDLVREPVQLGLLVREVVETARLLGEDQELVIDAPTSFTPRALIPRSRASVSVAPLKSPSSRFESSRFAFVSSAFIILTAPR